MNKLIYTSFLVTIFFIWGCSSEPPRQLPATKPQIKGTIISLKKSAAKNPQATAIILVEAQDERSSEYNKASIRVDTETFIMTTGGEPLLPGQLNEGLQVEAWFKGPVMESDPVQAHAVALRIEE